MACAAYDGLLAAALLMTAGFAYAGLTQLMGVERQVLGIRVVALALLAAYFVGFWSRRGQTLAMRTWRLRVQTPDGRSPSVARATARFALTGLWWLPALIVAAWLPAPTPRVIGLALLIGCVAYGALALLLPGRQFLHDLLAGTEIVNADPLR